MSSKNPITRFSNFLRDVKAELIKCNWPTWVELRQSTMVVVVSFLLLGAVVAASDYGLRWLIGKIL